MAVDQSTFVPAGRQAASSAEQVAFTETTRVGDELNIEWNSSSHPVVVAWKGTVVSKGGDNKTAVISWFDPPNLPTSTYPPTHPCNILRQNRVVVESDPWAQAVARSAQGTTVDSGPSPTDITTWSLFLDGSPAEKVQRIFNFSQWFRGYHQVFDKSLTQEASRDIHEKNLAILSIEAWVAAFYGKPEWRDTVMQSIIGTALFRLTQMRSCKDAAEMKKFANKFESLGMQSNNRLTKTTKNFRSGVSGNSD